jgi:hypothetical protein
MVKGSGDGTGMEKNEEVKRNGKRIWRWNR